MSKIGVMSEKTGSGKWGQGQNCSACSVLTKTKSEFFQIPSPADDAEAFSKRPGSTSVAPQDGHGIIPGAGGAMLTICFHHKLESDLSLFQLL